MSDAFFYMLLISFFGGIVASVSPCSIGALPLLLAYVCGIEKERGVKLFIKLLAFSAGLSFILGIIGLACAITGTVFGGFDTPVLTLLFGSFIMILGLHLLNVIEIPFPNFVKKMPDNSSKTGLFVYPFIVGVLFAFMSSPCSSPILVTIMAIAAKTSNYVNSFLLLFSFAMGQCIIIILAGIFASFLKGLKKIQQYTDYLLKFSGVILVLFALYLWINVWTDVII